MPFVFGAMAGSVPAGADPAQGGGCSSIKPGYPRIAYGGPQVDEVAWTFDFKICPFRQFSLVVWTAPWDLTLTGDTTVGGVNWNSLVRRKKDQFEIYAEEGEPSVTWESLALRRSTRTFLWWARENDVVFAKGSFRVRVRPYRYGHNRKAIPRRKVWEGTDEYFNYCIKKGKELFSEGGLLYCWKPGRPGSKRATAYSTTVTRLRTKLIPLTKPPALRPINP